MTRLQLVGTTTLTADTTKGMVLAKIRPALAAVLDDPAAATGVRFDAPDDHRDQGLAVGDVVVGEDVDGRSEPYGRAVHHMTVPVVGVPDDLLAVLGTSAEAVREADEGGDPVGVALFADPDGRRLALGQLARVGVDLEDGDGSGEEEVA